MERVPVPRSVLVGLVAALLSAMVGLAFLAGRESARARETLPPAPARRATDEHPSPAAPASAALAMPLAAPAAALGSAPAAGSDPPGAPWPAPVAGAAPSAERPAAPSPTSAAVDPAAVSAYFARVDQLQPGALGGEGGERFATELVTASTRGDFSGFDSLIHDAEQSRAALAAIDAPAPCRDFHRDCLAVLDEGIAMLRGIRESIARGDEGSLTQITGRATSLQKRTDALTEAERTLKQRYGAR